VHLLFRTCCPIGGITVDSLVTHSSHNRSLSVITTALSLILPKDSVTPDFVSLLRGAADGLEGTGSINHFVKGLFSAKAIATQAHPRNEDTIVAAQQAVKPMRVPSTRRKNTIKRMPTRQEKPHLLI
jgi:hypothetical protein